jgi:predicted site-specific integrase-resolvase
LHSTLHFFLKSKYRTNNRQIEKKRKIEVKEIEILLCKKRKIFLKLIKAISSNEVKRFFFISFELFNVLIEEISEEGSFEIS